MRLAEPCAELETMLIEREWDNTLLKEGLGEQCAEREIGGRVC